MDVEFLKYKFQDGCGGVLTETKLKLGVRHVQVLYMFLCAVVMGTARASVGIELLALVDTARANDTYIQIHVWDRRIQGTILSSFFFGYALALLPAELQLKRLGGKFVITSVLLINGALSAAMPTIVNRGGWAAMCNAYFLMGMTQACLSPANQALLSKWLPPAERRTLSCCIDAGVYLGMISALPLAGALTESRLGWELLFYSQAMMTLSMAAIWGLLTSSSPDQHQAVGDFEKEFIKEALAACRQKNLQKPWRSILRSRQMWAIACAHAAGNALFIFYLVDVPLYFKTMGFSLKQRAQLSMTPFAVLWLVYITITPTLDWIFKSGFLAYLVNLTYLRKLINALGASSIVVGLTVLPNVDAGLPYLRFSILIGIFGLLGLQYSGFLENLRDLSENYTGTLFTVSSSIAGVVGAVVPFISGLILRSGVEDSHSWEVIFYCLGGFYGVCNVIYTLVGSSARRPHAHSHGHRLGCDNPVHSRDDTNQTELLEMKHRMSFAELEDDTTV